MTYESLSNLGALTVVIIRVGGVSFLALERHTSDAAAYVNNIDDRGGGRGIKPSIIWPDTTQLILTTLTINVPLFKKLRDIIFFCGTITL